MRFALLRRITLADNIFARCRQYLTRYRFPRCSRSLGAARAASRNEARLGDRASCQAQQGRPCTFGSNTRDCKLQVQRYLDLWYADFDAVFIATPPADGQATYKVVVTSSPRWCQFDRNIAGVAPLDCENTDGGVAYAFQCATDPKLCAAIVAQEQAHLVGLVHTASRADVMHPRPHPRREGRLRGVAPIDQSKLSCRAFLGRVAARRSANRSAGRSRRKGQGRVSMVRP